MKQQLLHIASPVIFLLLARTLSAQPDAGNRHTHKGAAPAAATPPAVVIRTSVDKRQIIIGQPIQLMFEVAAPGNLSVDWPPLDSIPHFEWMEKGKVDSVIHPDQHSYRQYLTVTSFDSGVWSIPRLPFTAGNKKFFSDSVRIEVGYTKFDASKDYHDIKDIIDEPNPFAKWIAWIVAAITLGSLAVVVSLIRKKKLMKVINGAMTRAPVLPPYEEAVKQLDELEKQQLAENGSVKLHYTRLNDILRLFILRKLGISSLAETNEELIGQIRSLPVTPQQFDELAEMLRISDFVKFAKYQPGISDSGHSLTVTRSSVELLNKIGNAQEEAKNKTDNNTKN